MPIVVVALPTMNMAAQVYFWSDYINSLAQQLTTQMRVTSVLCCIVVSPRWSVCDEYIRVFWYGFPLAC